MAGTGGGNLAHWGSRYEAAMQGVDTRIAVRENILVGYIIAATTLAGIAMSNPQLRKLWVLIPYMAFATTLILVNHEIVISQMEEHLFNLVDQALANGADMKRDWYDRQRLGKGRKWGLISRTAAILIIIVGSSSVALWMSRGAVATHTATVARWVGVGVTVAIFGLIVGARIWRLHKMQMRTEQAENFCEGEAGEEIAKMTEEQEGNTKELTPEEIRLKSEELRFTYDQLRKEILHNDMLTLQILGGVVVLTGAVIGFAASTTSGNLLMKAILFFVTEGITLIGLFQVIDRGRSTFMLADYLRTFVEPEMQGMKWETRLHTFRTKQRRLGYGHFISYQGLIYGFLAFIHFCLSSWYLVKRFPGQLFGRASIADAIAIIILFVITACLLGYAWCFHRKVVTCHTKNTEKVWVEIKRAEDEAARQLG